MEETKITNIDKKTVEEAIEFILEEGKELGYQEAVRIYAKNYRDILKKGRRQGIVIGILSTVIAACAYRKMKTNLKEELEKEEKAKKTPYDIDIDEVKETKYEEE